MDDITFKKVRKREEEAFIEMMKDYKSIIYYTALTYLKNSDAALEAVQEVTFRAYKNVHKVKKAQALKAWLTRITINYCLDEIRKGKRVHPDNSTLEDVSVMVDPSTSLFVDGAIQTLKPKYQTVILLKYQQDLTLTEIADSLSIPIGTVKTYLNRALQELRAYAKKGGLAPNDYQS
ncbi:RNA polymerase sigma factor [Radiobacillus sp. PE A8.2]|uniref:RNA polymerase sigma factor n=1 Tax=Radiobacillus sp. PE A8.2 TaxID=3380349 RepID=UPI00388EF092